MEKIIWSLGLNLDQSKLESKEEIDDTDLSLLTSNVSEGYYVGIMRYDKGLFYMNDDDGRRIVNPAKFQPEVVTLMINALLKVDRKYKVVVTAKKTPGEVSLNAPKRDLQLKYEQTYLMKDIVKNRDWKEFECEFRPISDGTILTFEIGIMSLYDIRIIEIVEDDIVVEQPEIKEVTKKEKKSKNSKKIKGDVIEDDKPVVVKKRNDKKLQKFETPKPFREEILAYAKVDLGIDKEPKELAVLDGWGLKADLLEDGCVLISRDGFIGDLSEYIIDIKEYNIKNARPVGKSFDRLDTIHVKPSEVKFAFFGTNGKITYPYFNGSKSYVWVLVKQIVQ